MVFGIQTPTERRLLKELATESLRAHSAETGRDRLAKTLIYRELNRERPMLTVVSSILIGAGYTNAEALGLIEKTKREHSALH